MTNLAGTTFGLNGVTYEANSKGNYFYKSTGKEDKKGNPIMMRIPAASFEKAYEEYCDLRAEEEAACIDAEVYAETARDEARAELDLWQEEADLEREARAEEQEESDKEAENTVNKKESKPKKARRSKDIAHESNGVTLTAKQVDFIKHVPDTCFYERGLESTMWCDVLAEEIGGQFANKPMTIGAMVSTLREKSLIYVGVDRINGRKAKYFGFTELGKQVAMELGLN